MWYNGIEWEDDEKDYIQLYNKLVGGFMLKQKRIVENSPDSCVRSLRFGEFYPTCWPKYTESSASLDSYGPEHDPHKFFFEGERDGESAGPALAFFAYNTETLHIFLIL